jgi:Tfp pilus assembly protein PilF
MSALEKICGRKEFTLPQEKAQALSPELQKQLLSLGYLSGGDVNISDVNNARLTNPRNLADIANVVLREGPELLKAQKTHELLAKIREVLKRDPNNVSAIDLAGQAYLETGDPSRALELYTQGLKIAPTSYSMEFGLGRAYHALDNPAESRTHLNRALEFNTVYPDAYAYLADLYQREGRQDSAKALMESARKQCMQYSSVLFRRGHLLLQRGDCAAAVSLFEQALKEDPTLFEAMGPLVTCLYKKGDFVQAWPWVQKGLALQPGSAWMLKTGFTLAVRLNKRDEARALAEQFIRLYPDTQEARQFKERLPLLK